MPRAQPAHVARFLGVHWSRHAQAASLMSRPHFDVATSRQPESCRDIKSVSRHHQNTSMSRHQIGVATSFLLPSLKPGRHPMSRHQFHVATSWTTNLCRDIKFMSRHQFSTGQVATSVPCRDLLVATSHSVAHVATSISCRDTVSAAHAAAHVATSQ